MKKLEYFPCLFVLQNSMNVSKNCAVDSITSLIQSHVPDARMDRTDSGTELMYMLPLNSVSKFAGMYVCPTK